jgi:ribosomal protein L37AE/L43A
MEANDSRWQPSVNGQPREAHSARPDPEEPWRYLCPECMKHSLKAREKYGDFRCVNCDEAFEKFELYDKKAQ